MYPIVQFCCFFFFIYSSINRSFPLEPKIVPDERCRILTINTNNKLKFNSLQKPNNPLIIRAKKKRNVIINNAEFRIFSVY